MIRTPLLGLAAAATAAVLGAAPALAATLPGAAPAATTLSLRASKTTVAPGAKDVLTGTLKAGKSGLAGKKVQLERRAAGAKSFTKVGAPRTTGKGGTVTFTVVPGSKKGAKVQYELVFAGDSKDKASHSGVSTVTVK